MENNRDTTLDVVKGLIVLTLPIIHTVLFYCNPGVHNSTYGHILAFIAEQAAPAFMLVMGIVVTFGKPKSFEQILKRTIKLLFLGYLLNLLKFIIPALWSGLPSNLFLENGIEQSPSGLFKLLIIEDILQLAAISYLICALLYRLKHYAVWATIFVVLIVVFSPIAWRLNLSGSVFKIPLALINGIPPVAFFPIFPWISYPLAGLVVGYCLKNFPGKKAYLYLSFSGILLTLLGIVATNYEPTDWHVNFYRLGPSGTYFHIGSALLLLCLCHIVSTFLKSSIFLKLLTKLSINVTFAYMIQWIIVCWGLSLFGYHKMVIKEALLPMIIVCAFTVLLTYLFSYFKTAFLKWKRSNIERS